MKGIIGKKVGNTSLFREDGRVVNCTVIEAGPCTVVQKKTEETDGYDALQLGFGKKKDKHTTNALKGHFKAAGVNAHKKLIEFRDYEIDKEVGETVQVDIFEEDEIVNVVGRSKGKGFQGVVKRHGFGGVGMRTHGQHNRERAPGAIGMSSTPSRVLKGMRMGGRMGGDRVKVKNLKVVKVMPEKNLILIKGAVPGHNGAYVIIEN